MPVQYLVILVHLGVGYIWDGNSFLPLSYYAPTRRKQ